MDKICFICEDLLYKFIITPLLETPDKKLHQICEKCADENIPNWRDEDD